MTEFLEQQRKQNQNLSVYISQLHYVGLISSEQKMNIEEKTQPNDIRAEIFKLLMTMESVDASKMFLLLRAIDNGKISSYTATTTHNQVVHPLQTENAIKKVYRFLSLKDIKNCRLVNKIWRDESEPILRKRSCIKFYDYGKTPAEFNETFPPNTTLPFTSFKFNNFQWSILNFEQFFEQQRPNVIELELYAVILINENNQEAENYDISHWIETSPIKKLKMYTYGFKKLAVTLNRLNSIKYINLTETRINIWNKNGYLITPIEVKLKNVNFWEDGNKLKVYRINDEINFSNAEEIEITSSIDHNSTRLILDLAETFDVRVLSLCQVKVSNWTISKCSAETVILKNINFLKKTEMKIKKFIFEGDVINLDGLPATLETLSLRNPNADASVTERLTLNCLKTLYLNIKSDSNLEGLTCFKHCRNLMNIILNCEYSSEESGFLDLDWIPRSVKCITMTNVGRIHGHRNLETLKLYKYSLSAAKKILSKIKPEKLVLNWDKDYEANDGIISFMETFPGITLTIGPIYWGKGEFEKSRLAKYVDKKGEQYNFKNNKGQSVEFDLEFPVDFVNGCRYE